MDRQLAAYLAAEWDYEPDIPEQWDLGLPELICPRCGCDSCEDSRYVVETAECPDCGEEFSTAPDELEICGCSDPFCPCDKGARRASW